jgi:hypothetical protein
MSQLDKPMKPSREIALESTGRHPSVSAEGLDRAEAVRRASSGVGEKISAHKLSLPDSVFTRLELHAIKRGSTASAIAAEILDRQLPHHRITTDD